MRVAVFRLENNCDHPPDAGIDMPIFVKDGLRVLLFNLVVPF